MSSCNWPIVVVSCMKGLKLCVGPAEERCKRRPHRLALRSRHRLRSPGQASSTFLDCIRCCEVLIPDFQEHRDALFIWLFACRFHLLDSAAKIKCSNIQYAESCRHDAEIAQTLITISDQLIVPTQLSTSGSNRCCFSQSLFHTNPSHGSDSKPLEAGAGPSTRSA